MRTGMTPSQPVWNRRSTRHTMSTMSDLFRQTPGSASRASGAASPRTEPRRRATGCTGRGSRTDRSSHAALLESETRRVIQEMRLAANQNERQMRDHRRSSVPSPGKRVRTTPVHARHGPRSRTCKAPPSRPPSAPDQGSDSRGALRRLRRQS